MDISEVKQNLGRRVRVLNERLLLDGEYGITREQIEDVIKEKLLRQLDRIDKEKEAQT